MRKIVLTIIFFAIILIMPKAEAAGNVTLSTNKSSINIGDEFTINLSFSRITGCITYSANNCRYK